MIEPPAPGEPVVVVLPMVVVLPFAPPAPEGPNVLCVPPPPHAAASSEATKAPIGARLPTKSKDEGLIEFMHF
jgi:hypothetical protein